MIYRENGQFKTSYRADQQILPIRQDRWAMLALLVLAFVVVPMTASDYMFRGVSQSDDHPALQLGADYSFASGFYVGVWGSNVDFGDSTDAEIDTFIGWNGDVADGVNLDVMLNRYNYVNEPSDVDYAYNELIGKVTLVSVCVPALPPIEATMGISTASATMAARDSSKRPMKAAAMKAVTTLTASHGRRAATVSRTSR